jgi:hypothetical protein
MEGNETVLKIAQFIRNETQIRVNLAKWEIKQPFQRANLTIQISQWEEEEEGSNLFIEERFSAGKF